MPVIHCYELGRLRQDSELRASLGYILKDSIRKKDEVYLGFLVPAFEGDPSFLPSLSVPLPLPPLSLHSLTDSPKTLLHLHLKSNLSSPQTSTPNLGDRPSTHPHLGVTSTPPHLLCGL